MLNRIFGQNVHTSLHVLGLCGVAVGIPLNKVVMSVSMLFLALNLLLESDFKTYWNNIKQHKIYHVILLFFLFKLLSLTWTSNFGYAIHDFRVKLPLLAITTVLAVKPIVNRTHLHLILVAFVTSTILVSFINFGMYQHWIGSRNYDDIRGMSIFSSHIRYALTVTFSIGILLHFYSFSKKYWPLISVLILWLLFYTYYSQVVSGYLTLIGVLGVFLIYKLWNTNRIIIRSIGLVFIVLSTFFSLWLFTPIEINHSDYKDLPKQTAKGAYYTNHFSAVSPVTEKPIYILVCEAELRNDWPMYSRIHFDTLDKKGQPIKSTIIRYLSSKDLTKDAEGLSNLIPGDIQAIENGEASYINTGITARLYGIKYQLNNTDNPNNHSLLERFEYWKAGAQILSDNYIFGVGVGDVDDAFKSYYKKSNTLLTEENQHRSHNMYLTVFITLGIVGLSIFTLLHIQFIRLNLTHKNLLALIFIVIMLLSFLIEDTLETQTGITFYALFLGLFFSSKQAEKID
ncbi:MAG: O-antigen ligase family protein [Crocinitomicaceae bacterium]|nr:O-antigen ligase family protein [Crocinitomicaceae bacterium]MDG1775835.1 O-antigen ligase family protein [Crocinitomicaceae bacterium]